MENCNVNILYVDDELVNTQLFFLNLKKHYNVTTSLTPIEGLKLLAEKKFDIVVTDFKMPLMNGIDFIKEIKKQYPEKVCMIVSGYIDEDIIPDQDRSLVFDVLAKPWNKEILLNAIDKAILTL